MLISWAQTSPSKYFPKLAAIIKPFMKANESDSLEWTSLSMQLLELAPDRVSVLRAFGRHFYPRSWSGSLAEIFERCRQLLQVLVSYPDPIVVEWAKARDESLVREIEHERSQERRQGVDARFEY